MVGLGRGEVERWLNPSLSFDLRWKMFASFDMWNIMEGVCINLQI
jgi:hypothetical protein